MLEVNYRCKRYWNKGIVRYRPDTDDPNPIYATHLPLLDLFRHFKCKIVKMVVVVLLTFTSIKIIIIAQFDISS